MAVPLHTEPAVDRDEAFQRAMHRTLAATEDHTRRIHWWVRLFGICWLASMALAVIGAVLFAVAFTGAATTSSSTSGSTSLFENCLRNGGSTNSCRVFLD